MTSSFVTRPALAVGAPFTAALLTTLGAAGLVVALTAAPAQAAFPSGTRIISEGSIAFDTFAATEDRSLSRDRNSGHSQVRPQRQDQGRGQVPDTRPQQDSTPPTGIPPASYPAYPPPAPPHPYRPYGLDPAPPYFDGRPSYENFAPGRGDRR